MTNQQHIVEPDTFDFFTDDHTRNEPVVGMRVNGFFGQTVTIPMNADTAEQVGELLLAHARMFRDLPPAVSPAKARIQRYPVAAE